MTKPQHVSFEKGLERLEVIAEKLGEAELSVEETIALLREGKGLEQALRGYLETAEHDLQEIEAGRGLTEFVIDRPADKPKS
ncbi:MAG: exodeoxyribonuclease VII small subunit [Thermoleophilia bacterium]|jgi:exodeoxyribonuclease VII small subunit